MLLNVGKKYMSRKTLVLVCVVTIAMALGCQESQEQKHQYREQLEAALKEAEIERAVAKRLSEQVDALMSQVQDIEEENHRLRKQLDAAGAMAQRADESSFIPKTPQLPSGGVYDIPGPAAGPGEFPHIPQ